ncbi:MAG: 4'-phosphopantetheinyl transferase superfamily protein [Acidobacteriia bacterium]|nr:4'-phosphopantetheinyl transferase superfamily protein [Terriglobia bacterium]
MAAARDVDVGVDVERRRPIPEYEAIAERFFPPSQWRAFARNPAGDRERDFFRRWTRLEAMLKARGIGLYGAGIEQGGQWTVHEIDAGENYAAAVAATAKGMQLRVHDFS